MQNILEKQPELLECQYQISVLRDEFVPMILDALGKVKTEKVWAKTAKTSTVYRGKAVHVVDCVKACFSHIFDDSMPYIGMTAVFYKNSCDDFSEDCFIAEDDILLNDTKKSFNVLARIQVFPLGIADYEKYADVVATFSEKRNVKAVKGHYTYELEGDVHDMFALLNDVLDYNNKHLENYALSTSMTIYGPEAVS